MRESAAAAVAGIKKRVQGGGVSGFDGCPNWAEACLQNGSPGGALLSLAGWSSIRVASLAPALVGFH